MESIVTTIKDTPLPTILIMAGVIFLLLSVATEIRGIIKLDEKHRPMARLFGLLLLIIGLTLYFIPSPSPPIPADSKSNEKPVAALKDPSSVVDKAFELNSKGQLQAVFAANTILCDPIRKSYPALEWFSRFISEHPERSGRRTNKEWVSWIYQNTSFAQPLGIQSLDEIANVRIHNGKINRVMVYFPEHSITQLEQACKNAGNPTLWGNVACPIFVNAARQQTAKVSSAVESAQDITGC